MRKNSRRRAGRSFLLIILLIFAVIIAVNSSSVKKLNYPVKFKEHVLRYSNEYKIDNKLIFAIIKAESNFRENATSNKDAKGLMQLMDATAKELAKRLGIKDFSEEDLYEPELNIRIGCYYVSKLMGMFNGKEDLVITAYNGGSGNVKKWLLNKDYSIDGINLNYIPFSETENFLKKVKRYKSEYKKLYENEF